MKCRGSEAGSVSALPLVAEVCDRGSHEAGLPRVCPPRRETCRVAPASVGWAFVNVFATGNVQLEVHLTGVEEVRSTFDVGIRFKHIGPRGATTWQTKWAGLMSTDNQGNGSCHAVTYVDDIAEGSVGCQVRIVQVAGAGLHDCDGGTKCYVSGPGLFSAAAE